MGWRQDDGKIRYSRIGLWLCVCLGWCGLVRVGYGQQPSLEGNWYAQAVLPVAWPSNLAIVGGESVITLHWLHHRKACEQGICDVVQLCTLTIPAVKGRWENTWYGMDLPIRIAEELILPIETLHSQWEPSEDDSVQVRLNFSPWRVQLGAALPSHLPGYELLNQSEMYQWDMDRDGFAGMTWHTRSESPFSHPRTNMNLFSSYRAIAYHSAWHFTLAMQLHRIGEDLLEGTMEPVYHGERPGIYSIILGCMRNDNTLCQSHEVRLANQHNVVYRFPRPGQVQLRKAAESAFSCRDGLVGAFE